MLQLYYDAHIVGMDLLSALNDTHQTHTNLIPVHGSYTSNRWYFILFIKFNSLLVIFNYAIVFLQHLECDVIFHSIGPVSKDCEKKLEFHWLLMKIKVMLHSDSVREIKALM